MRFDIKVQLKQICGRIRGAENNKIIYLWTTQEEDTLVTEEQYLFAVTKSKTQSITNFEFLKSNEEGMKMLNNSARSGHDHIILDQGVAIIHPYSIEALMSNYHAMYSDSMVLRSKGDKEASETVTNKLGDLNPNLNTHIIPKLDPEYTKKLGRTPSVRNILAHYESILDDSRTNPNFASDLETFLVNNETFAEWLECGVTPQNIRSLKENREKISEYALSLRLIKTASAPTLELNKFYSSKDIKDILKAYYTKNKIQATAKASSLTQWFEVKASKQKVHNSEETINGFIILNTK